MVRSKFCICFHSHSGLGYEFIHLYHTPHTHIAKRATSQALLGSSRWPCGFARLKALGGRFSQRCSTQATKYRLIQLGQTPRLAHSIHSLCLAQSCACGPPRPFIWPCHVQSPGSARSLQTNQDPYKPVLRGPYLSDISILNVSKLRDTLLPKTEGHKPLETQSSWSWLT